jgi:hypothetical protein
MLVIGRSSDLLPFRRLPILSSVASAKEDLVLFIRTPTCAEASVGNSGKIAEKSLELTAAGTVQDLHLIPFYQKPDWLLSTKNVGKCMKYIFASQ